MTELILLGSLYKHAVFAIVAGGIIGIERERKHKSAGLKTNIFICLGAMLFTVIAGLVSDYGHILGQIIPGIGFLGAGAILRPTVDKVSGLTTASIAWLVAGLGMLVGLDHGPVAVGLSILIVGLTTSIGWIERRVRAPRT